MAYVLPTTPHKWVVDNLAGGLPSFDTLDAAHDLWDKLLKEYTYRLSLNNSDEYSDALLNVYDVIEEIAEAMVDLRATTGYEIAQKIDVALWCINSGLSPTGWEKRLLQSAAKDAVLFKVVANDVAIKRAA